jgi:hypothetical protein
MDKVQEDRLTDALVDTASMYTLSKTTFLVRTKNVVQHGESLRCSPDTSMFVALSVKKSTGRRYLLFGSRISAPEKPSHHACPFPFITPEP